MSLSPTSRGAAYPVIAALLVLLLALSFTVSSADAAKKPRYPAPTVPPPPPPPPPPLPPPPPPPVVTEPVTAAAYVDRDSRGGQCSDLRTYDQARSVTTPWCSLDRAVRTAPGGATVIVRAGTYPELVLDAGPVRTSYLTLKAYAGEKPSTSLVLEDTSYLSFEGLRLSSAWLTRVDHVRLRGNEVTPQGVVVRVGSFLDFENNYFHDIALSPNQTLVGYAIRLVSGPITDVRIVGNKFDRITSDAIQAGSTTRILIEGNEIARCNAWGDPTEHADGIQFYGPVADAIIRRNWFHDNNHTIIIKGYVYPGLVIENNLIHTSASGLNLYDTPGARIINNTIWGMSDFGLRLSQLTGEMRSVVLANNIIDKSFTTSTWLSVNAGNQIGGNPLFLAGYQLGVGSSALNVASLAYAPPADRLGRSRYLIPDVGSEERQGL